MKKTLALLLAAFLYLAPARPLVVKSQTMPAPGKYQTVANPIPGRYIVVLATTDLSPIANPAPTPIAAAPKSGSTFAARTFSADSSAMAVVAEPVPDPGVVATANYLTSTYGGTYSLIWSVALKGFRLNATDAQ